MLEQLGLWIINNAILNPVYIGGCVIIALILILLSIIRVIYSILKERLDG
jgi:hypothetical protein